MSEQRIDRQQVEIKRKIRMQFVDRLWDGSLWSVISSPLLEHI